MAFDKQAVIFTPFIRIGEIEKGPGGLMADYGMTGHYQGESAEYACKVLHRVDVPEEPEGDFYEMSLDIGHQVICKTLEFKSNTNDRAKMAKALASSDGLKADEITHSDVHWDEVKFHNDIVYLNGTLAGQTLSATCHKEAYEKACHEGFQDTTIQDMKNSVLHAFRAAYRAVHVQN